MVKPRKWIVAMGQKAHSLRLMIRKVMYGKLGIAAVVIVVLTAGLTIGGLIYWQKVMSVHISTTPTVPSQPQRPGSAQEPAAKSQAKQANKQQSSSPTSPISKQATSATNTNHPSPTLNLACKTTAMHVPDGKDPWGGCWPGPSNTGVPAGTQLSLYAGPCTINVANTVINAKTVDCGLTIQAVGVTITNSKLNGGIYLDSEDTTSSFTVSDSTVDAGNGAYTGIGGRNFVATRVHVYNGNRSILCEYNCTVQDSWVHGQFTDNGGTTHESGIRMGDGSVIRHNSILCDAPDIPPDAGCSADLTGYGDFATIQNNTIDSNLFVATTGGACAYGGSSGSDGSKPYGAYANHIVFKNNIFQRGHTLSDQNTYICGYYFPVTSFDSTRPGNQWINNNWDDGTVVPPAN